VSPTDDEPVAFVTEDFLHELQRRNSWRYIIFRLLIATFITAALIVPMQIEAPVVVS
jgi:hypothetical protein